MSELSVEEQIAAKVAGTLLDTPPPDEPVEGDTGEEQAEPEVSPDQIEIPETEPSEPEPAPLLAGKYKSAEELERAYDELQRKLDEQGNELGQLRQLNNEVAALRDQINQPAPTPQYDPNSIDEWLAENPQQIPAMAQQAVERGDGYLYNRALAAWAELDPMGASTFNAQQIAAAQMQALRDELAPALERVQRVETTSQFQTAWDRAAAKHDDFAPVLSSITQETLDGFPPEVLNALQTGDEASKERVLETLYRWQKAEQAGNLNVAAQAAVAQQQEANRQARQEAAVAGTQASAGREPEQGTDPWKEAFRNSDAFKKAAGLI